MADEAGATLSNDPFDDASQMNPKNLIAVGALTFLLIFSFPRYPLIPHMII